MGYNVALFSLNEAYVALVYALWLVFDSLFVYIYISDFDIFSLSLTSCLVVLSRNSQYSVSVIFRRRMGGGGGLAEWKFSPRLVRM